MDQALTASSASPARTHRRRSTVGVRELRQNLSVHLERVKKGEALIVTEHGAAVAILRPLPSRSTALDRLVAAGLATRPSRSARALPRPLRLRLARTVHEVLDELRTERL
jgi:prevent-host-death family protein